jgi:hypothetical protein
VLNKKAVIGIQSLSFKEAEALNLKITIRPTPTFSVGSNLRF